MLRKAQDSEWLNIKGSKDTLIEHGFTSAPTQYRLYGRRFLQV